MQLIDGAESENIIDRINEVGNMPVLPSGNNNNMKVDDMNFLFCVGITIGGNNNPATDNVPAQKTTTEGGVTYGVQPKTSPFLHVMSFE